jgi:hypothetical protein
LKTYFTSLLLLTGTNQKPNFVRIEWGQITRHTLSVYIKTRPATNEMALGNEQHHPIQS